MGSRDASVRRARLERAAEAPGDGLEQRERREPADSWIGHRADAKRDGAMLQRAVSSLRPKLTPLALLGATTLVALVVTVSVL